LLEAGYRTLRHRHVVNEINLDDRNGT